MSAWLDSAQNGPAWAPPPGARLGAATWVKRQFPTLREMLQAAAIAPLELSIMAPDGVVGWGGRLQARLARRYAVARGLPYWSLEDGFLRSVGLGKSKAASISILVDDCGLHHDPRVASRLEALIIEGARSVDIELARTIRARLIEEGITKYNLGDDQRLDLSAAKRSKRILLVDQVAGDASIACYGGAAFSCMWRDALDQDADILVRDHPDVLAGFATGALRNLTADATRRVFDGRGELDRLLAEVDEIWTVSSQLGFEALLRGKRVVTYGMPFYAGWSLTEDRAADAASAMARARRTKRISIDELVAAALVRYPIYFDPVRNKTITVTRALDRLASWKQKANRFSGSHVCVGFSRHKHKTAKLFLETPQSAVTFRRSLRAARRAANHESTLVFWGHRADKTASEPCLTIEDGFIRSVGLGARLVKPRSLCIDPTGIYYDATRPSQLEVILNTTVFDDAILNRARHLRRTIVNAQVSKYNVSDAIFDVRSLKASRPIALVAEQVPDDASLRFGMAVHHTSLALVKKVRALRPHHFILFKRHPDIVSGARSSRHTTAHFSAYADHVLDQEIDVGWQGIDECHSLTSQIGFEALLRGVKTFCHGAPFYSGWGLTMDSVVIDRRRRTLSLDELVAGTLILYPSYRCWRSGLPCDVEDVIRDIVIERDMMLSCVAHVEARE